jgi:ABC-type polysaccharide/polyol phosphate export permease
MLRYLSSVWDCRFFWVSLVKMDLRTRYRRSILGMGWSLLHPIAMTTIMCTVFPKIMNISVTEYAPYLLAGLVFWHYLINVTIAGCQCIFQGESYIRQYPAPFAIYPLRTALGAIIHFFLALAVLLVMTWFFKGLHFSALTSLLPTVGLLFVLGWSLALLAGFANVYFQDTQHLCDVGFQILFYATPVIYRAKDVEGRGIGWLVEYNPLVPFLDLIRSPIVEGHFPSLYSYGMATAIVLFLASAASFVQSRLQRGLIFHL